MNSCLFISIMNIRNSSWQAQIHHLNENNVAEIGKKCNPKLALVFSFDLLTSNMSSEAVR
jgi:hypothetical protein